jgi:hypothetical protein
MSSLQDDGVFENISEKMLYGMLSLNLANFCVFLGRIFDHEQDLSAWFQ